MGSLSLSTLRTMIRDDLNVTSSILSDTELNAVLNDGYKDVSVKGLCYESTLTKSNIAGKVLPLASDNVIRVNFVEYSGGAKGIPGIIPQSVGNNPIAGYSPQGWFQWGKYLVIEPPPDVLTYDLNVFASCLPAAQMTGDTDTPASLPAEFHTCVYRFGKAFAAMKLRRWADAGGMYNEYVADVLKKRAEFISKHPDGRLMREEPDNVKGATNG